MRTRRTIKGFTLFEIIIGLSILSILSVYAVPNFQGFTQNNTMTQELNRLARTINFARNQSVIMSQSIVLCPSHSMNACDGESLWHQGWLVFADINRDKQLGPNDHLLLAEQGMKNGLSAVSSQFRRTIRFDQAGFSPGTNLTIRFCDQRGSDYGKAIIISNVGRPRVSKTINACN